LDRCEVEAAYRLTPMGAEHPIATHACETHHPVALGTAPRSHVERIAHHTFAFDRAAA
jgi:hypothetical protein